MFLWNFPAYFIFLEFQHLAFSLKNYIFIYLKGRIGEGERERLNMHKTHNTLVVVGIWRLTQMGEGDGGRERERHRERFHSLGSLIKWPQQTGTWNFIVSPEVGSRGQSTWIIFCCFARHIIRKLDQNWSSWHCRRWLNLLWHMTCSHHY